MCFSYTLNTSIENLEERYNAGKSNHKFDPIYYVNGFTYPTMPIVTNDEPKLLNFYQWGLIPHWVKNESKAEEIKKFTLNARAETIFEKPSFKTSVISRRCLIPATGFFEWQHRQKEKIPYFIFPRSKKIFSFAGIWDRYLNESGEEIRTFSIITCKANKMMEEIHNSKKRMPVILDQGQEHLWLDFDLKPANIMQVLQMKNYDFDAYTISKSLGNKKTDSNNPNVYDRYNYDTPTLGI